jgi:predicted membrane protein DUF2254
MSTSSAMAIYSSIASGMIAPTRIVFSLTFVMVQFSATAYSPRLVPWIARDQVMSHVLGVFTATFLYGIAALTGVDRSGSGHVPIFSALVELALLLFGSRLMATSGSEAQPVWGAQRTPPRGNGIPYWNNRSRSVDPTSRNQSELQYRRLRSFRWKLLERGSLLAVFLAGQAELRIEA